MQLMQLASPQSMLQSCRRPARAGVARSGCSLHRCSSSSRTLACRAAARDSQPEVLVVGSSAAAAGAAPPPAAAAAADVHGRRGVLGGAAAAAATLLLAPTACRAEDEPAAAPSAPAAPSTTPGRRVYLDVTVEGRGPVGRVVIQLDGPPVASTRFADLAEGKEGVGFRLSKFIGIFPTYISNEGVKSLSYNAAGSSAIAGGDSVQALEEELAASDRSHDAPGLVSLVVREATQRPVKERLVAMRGKLVTLKEQAGEAPNGTGFMITTAPSPALDKTNLVVGRVVEGMEVVQQLAALPYAKPRDSLYDKPFFAAGKAMGDKRATVAEARFNRPLKRVMVANSGYVN